MARQIFYDRLLADYAEHPRTILLSTHLIDEVANCSSNVVVIDRGRIVADASVDDLRARAVAVSGRKGAVDEFVAHREVLSRQGVGSLATAIVAGPLDDIARAGAATFSWNSDRYRCRNSSFAAPVTCGKRISA